MLALLRKARIKDKEMRVLMLGLDNAGKTTIVKRIMNEDIQTVSPTLGFNIRTVECNGYRLNICVMKHSLSLLNETLTASGDVGGQKSLRSYWRNYFEKTEALIWVVDATDHLRMADCRAELHALLKEERLTGASLLIFINKTDISGCLSDEDVQQALDLSSIKTHQCKTMRSSAVSGAGLHEGIDWLIEDAKNRLFLL